MHALNQALCTSCHKILFDTRARRWFYPHKSFSPSLRSGANVPTDKINFTYYYRYLLLWLAVEGFYFFFMLNETQTSRGELRKLCKTKEKKERRVQRNMKVAIFRAKSALYAIRAYERRKANDRFPVFREKVARVPSSSRISDLALHGSVSFSLYSTMAHGAFWIFKRTRAFPYKRSVI